MIHPPVVKKQMMNKLQGKDFLQMDDFTAEELMELIKFAIQLKNKQKLEESHRYLEGNTTVMIIETSTTRTLVYCETGRFQCGGMAQFLSKNDMQLGNVDTISDTAKTLSRYV